jgi:fused signal recognition particle receptor
MARDWNELFLTSAPVAAAAPAAGETEEGRRGFFRRLRENMRKTREALSAEVQATLFEGDLDAETWERLEEALIYADVGARTTAQVVEQLEREATEGGITGGQALSDRLVELLAEIARTGDDRIDLSPQPTVILMAGVNGTGMVDGLRGLGADIEAGPDGFLVRGTGGLRGGRLDAHGDHRLALLGAVAGLASQEGVEVLGMDAAAVSYPGFAQDIAELAQ